MHLTWAEASRETPLSPAWRRLLWPAYALSFALPLVAIGIALPDATTRAAQIAGEAIGIGLNLAFVGAAAYSIALIRRHGNASDLRQRRSRRALVGLFGVMGSLFVFLLAVRGIAASMAYLGRLLEISAKSLPLIFMFVGTYDENQFRFFDLLVKRGAALLIALGGLTLWFAIVMPALARTFNPQWAAPWIYAVALLPVVGAMPWLYARIAATLDRRWLGRRFTAVEAVKRFLSGLRSATTEAQLIEHAQEGLTDIFDAPSVVVIGERATPPPFDVQQRVAVRAGTTCWARS